MKRMILLALLITGCSSVRKIDGNQFLDHEANERTNLPQHGFLKADPNQDVCGKDSTIRGGYFVIPRKARSGETESEFNKYLASEQIRAQVCAKVSLWCSTQTDLLCRADDQNCKDENGRMGQRSTCRVKPGDLSDGKLSPILDKSGDEPRIMCGTAQDEYIAPLAWTTSTNKAFVRDRTKWIQFCQEYRPADECVAIIRENETSSFLIQPDAARWIIDVLVKEKATVREDGDVIYSTMELDVAPACGLMEKRH